jgi:hypothetical protein
MKSAPAITYRLPGPPPPYDAGVLISFAAASVTAPAITTDGKTTAHNKTTRNFFMFSSREDYFKTLYALNYTPSIKKIQIKIALLNME